MDGSGAALDYFATLVAKVDDHFGRVAARYPEQLHCHTGCADCCVAGLTVTRVEASAIAGAVAALPAEARQALAERARAVAAGDPCPALDGDHHCVIYPARPLVCRSHGAPIRTDQRLEVCPLNFGGFDLDTLDPDCVVDQGTLSTLLGAVDAAYTDACGLPRGDRIALVDLFRHPDRSCPEDPR